MSKIPLVNKVADSGILVESSFSVEFDKDPVCIPLPVNLNRGHGSGQSKSRIRNSSLRLGLPNIMARKCCIGGAVAMH